MPTDLKATVTRKIGPLPAWGWIAAAGGAIVVVKLVGGGKGAAQTAQTPQVAPGDATDQSTSDGGVFEGPSSLVSQLQTTVGSLGNVQQLQAKLISALNQRATYLSTRATLQNQINGYKDALAKCKTAACKSKQNSLIKQANARQTANSKSLSTTEATIADLQKQLQGTST